MLKAYKKESFVIDMIAFKDVLDKAPPSDKNFFEHLLGGLNFDSEKLEVKLKSLNRSCSELEFCLLLRNLNHRWDNCYGQLVALIHLVEAS